MEYSSGVFLFTLGTWRGEVSVERHVARVEEIIQIGSFEMDAYLLGENSFSTDNYYAEIVMQSVSVLSLPFRSDPSNLLSYALFISRY